MNRFFPSAVAGVVLGALTGFGAVTHYAVDPLGEVPYLPDAAPKGGEKGGTVRIVAAQGEYEPGSFVLVSDTDLGKVQLEIGELKREEGTGNGEQGSVGFPKDKIDLKTVKVWYQAGTAWYSYFGDSGLKLCPELLLNDEDLVRVDRGKRTNYARLIAKDGTVSYRWLNPSPALETRHEDVTRYYPATGSFDCMKENFSDAKAFAGATLAKGEHKQFFLTVHVTKDIPAGLYRGEIKVKSKSEKVKGAVASVPVALRVLDFELPGPKCYYDCTKDYDTHMCQYVGLRQVMDLNGNDRELGERQLTEILRHFVAHGETIPGYRDARKHPEWGRAAGQDFTKVGAGTMYLGAVVESRYQARRLKERMTRQFGWHRPLATWGDEFKLETLRNIRGMVEAYGELGFRFQVNSRYGYQAAAYLADLWWPPYSPDFTSAPETAKYNEAMGFTGSFGWYASQHVGVENPAFCRRQYGFGPYRAGFGCNYNYAHHLCGWNDLTDGYRSMMLVYGTGDGCVDTLAYEGLREGLDDIRYATKLKMLAEPLAGSENLAQRYAARKALQLLADANTDDMDLTTLRLEMIGHIEKLIALGK